MFVRPCRIFPYMIFYSIEFIYAKLSSVSKEIPPLLGFNGGHFVFSRYRPIRAFVTLSPYQILFYTQNATSVPNLMLLLNFAQLMCLTTRLYQPSVIINE